MKILLTIIISFFLPLKGLLGQTMGLTKAELIKFDIIKIITKTSVGNRERQSTTFYDKNGNPVMFLNIDSNYKYILYSEYKDSLLMKQTEVTYENGEIADSLITRFSYKFDNKGRIIENALLRPNEEISINKLIYNNLGEIDTTYRYKSHDTVSARILTECCKYIYRAGKVLRYCYDSLGWDSPNLKIVESSDSDTLMNSFTQECKVVDKEIKCYKSYTTKLFLKEGRQMKFEHKNGDILVEHFYEKDHQGLVVQHISRTKSRGSERTQIDKFEYYFRH